MIAFWTFCLFMNVFGAAANIALGNWGLFVLNVIGTVCSVRCLSRFTG